MTLLGSKFSKATLGLVLCRLRLRRISNHLRAIIGVYPSEWAPWVPDWYIEESNRRMRGEYGKAKTSNQRAFVLHHGCSAEEAAVMEKNFALAFEKVMGEKAEDGEIGEFLPEKRTTPLRFVNEAGETVDIWCPKCRVVHVPPACELNSDAHRD